MSNWAISSLLLHQGSIILAGYRVGYWVNVSDPEFGIVFEFLVTHLPQ